MRESDSSPNLAKTSEKKQQFSTSGIIHFSIVKLLQAAKNGYNFFLSGEDLEVFPNVKTTICKQQQMAIVINAHESTFVDLGS